jgi:hypothetical protein
MKQQQGRSFWHNKTLEQDALDVLAVMHISQ